LYYDGWKFEVSFDAYRDSYIVAYRSPDGNAHGVTEGIQRHALMNGLTDWLQRIRCRITMGRDAYLSILGKADLNTYTADMSCEPVDIRTIPVGQLFKPEEPKLIIDQNDVSDLMNRIIELQEPARQERIRDRVKQSKQTTSISAKFISLS
jgi:hypothetical protein